MVGDDSRKVPGGGGPVSNVPTEGIGGNLLPPGTSLVMIGPVPAPAPRTLPRGRDPERPWTGTLTTEAEALIKARVSRAGGATS